MVKQTSEQLRASNPKSSVWVGASAGTGKTFVLSNRVLRLMLSGSNPNKILCLTYTNTAAAEMAIRVNKRLSGWITMDDAALFAELENVLGEKPSSELMLLARKLFAKVLDVPGGLKIQTIHSFCQSLLGRFPIEADISPNFELLDDITIHEQLRLSQDELLIEIADGERDELSKALEQISGMLAEGTFSDLMRNLSNERGGLEKLFERNARSFSEIDKSLKELIGFEKGDTRESILAAACDIDVSGLKQAADDLMAGTKTDKGRGEIILSWVNKPDDRVRNFNDYKLAFLTAKDEIRAKLTTKKVMEDFPDSVDCLFKEAERVKFTVERLRAYSLYENTRNILRIGFELIGKYNSRKKSHNVVDFDDLIGKVSLLVHKIDASWILYKLDEGIDHILIDEAQDTNPIQWNIIRKITQEFFTGAGNREEEDLFENPRTIFAVGDIKQSIYSFQKAEPKKFDENKRYFVKQANDAGLKFDEVPMNLSFRSTSTVLGAVDQVFDGEEKRFSVSFSHNEIKHDTHRENEPGLIEVWETVEPPEEAEEEGWSPPVIQKPSEDPKRIVAEKIAKQIKSWIDAKEILPSKGRPITAGDVLILVQKRKEFVHYMISALKELDVNVAGLDQMVLTEQLPVMDLMAVANFTLLPSDDLTLAVVLKSPFIGFSEDDLFDLANPRGKQESLWQALLKRRNEREVFSDAANFLTALTDYADFYPPFEFFNYLLSAKGGREKLIARLGEQINDPVDEFLNQAMKYEQNNISSMQGFINWFTKGDIKIKRDMEQGGDMVRIMTVHGAKGLQAPIVFLPDTCQSAGLRDNLFWTKEGLSEQLLYVRNEETRVGPAKVAYEARKRDIEDENKRLLYVAMTRAEDQLYVTGWEDKKGRQDGNWYDLIRDAVSSMGGSEKLDRNGENILTFNQGTKVVVPAPEEKKESIVTEALPIWAKLPPMSEPTPSRPLSPSRPETEEEEISRSPLKLAEEMAKDKRKYHRGRVIHKLLEILPDVEIGERDEATFKYLSQSALELSQDDIGQISSEVMGILNDNELLEVFGPNSRAEVPIVGQVGSYTLSGQVDRLAVTDDEILVIDYKTNRPPPSSPEKIPSIYQKQMAAYRAVLTDIYPDKRIRSFLLWTDIGSLMEIPEEILNKINF
ncbi:double-strand break repair helicase AddA [Pseudemcibacter aquimaris]|uniref:double-strand break repair helicase AddA n=1 Tax=Pseudemcibacter aquimaris TaxID=2857064 RepID=UPI002011FBD4|nr:double-strand break repair helicase AddA [Pseudemcibacter aquimaris]MCC3860268.1 double-strand break repair helicase AddA [Pseudemcibacter aquimaris]WDU57593.1 double-strand break repair helicase AddA [Pseudemcibacter aquimaris]